MAGIGEEGAGAWRSSGVDDDIDDECPRCHLIGTATDSDHRHFGSFSTYAPRHVSVPAFMIHWSPLHR
jgi:hypothetical protein